MKMTSRERVLAAIDQKPVDRVPMDMLYTYSALNKLCKYMHWDHLCVNTANIWGVAYPDPEFNEKMGLDCVYVGLRPPSGTAPLRFGIDETYTTEFGHTWRKEIQPSGSIEYEPVNTPAKDWSLEDLAAWKMPDPEDDAIFEGFYERCRDLHENTDKAVCGNLGASLFNVASMLRGMEDWYMDMALNPEITDLFMKRLTGYYTKMYEKALDIAGKYIDFLRIDNDDFGTQKGPLISGEMFRGQVKPYSRSFYASVRKKYAQVNPSGRIMKHSCGDNTAYIDDFIEIGVDMLDPLQPLAGKMNREFLSKYKGRIAFHGNVDVQWVMPMGTVEDVRKDVKDAIRSLASPSGYVCGTAHHVMSDVPVENMLALREAILEYGLVKDGKLVNL